LAAVALAGSPLPRKLRVGLFADSRVQPRWVAQAFGAVARSGFAEIALIAAAGLEPAREPWLLRAYGALDQWAFGAEPCEPVDLPRELPEAALHEAGTGPVPDYQGLELDVAFALGGVDDGALEGLARCGVWRFALDGFGEVARGEPLSGCALEVRLGEGAPPRRACESWSRTYPLSVARNRRELAHRAGGLVLRALAEVQRSGVEWLERQPPARCARDPLVRGSGAQGNRALTPILARIGARIAQRAAQKALYVEQWQLAFRFGPGGPDAELTGFTRIAPPAADRDWADPFVLEKNGRHYLFFEELPYAARKAHIAMIELAPDGSRSAPVRVLERDYHLSYPFLLEHDGELYLVPESAQNASVELYRCVDFPLRWRLERKLIDGARLVDATLHRGAGRWWLFANGAPGGSRVFDDELHLYHADSLFGEWQPHPRNPVKSDARCARSAGRPYLRDGVLYRPAQVCVPRYGAGLSINRVLRLTPQAYAEREVRRLMPDPRSGVLGLHTVNRAGYLTAIDLFTRRRRI
jgi:hypothetical protein